MKRILFATLLSGSALAAATPASAAIIIGIGFNGGAVTQVATDVGGSANYNSTNGGYFYNSGATGAPILPTPGLLTQLINIQQGSATGGTVNLYITQTDQTAFNGNLISTFTSNTIQNATAVLRTYYSTSNALFGGTQLQSAAFNSTGVFSGNNFLNLAGLFSTTVRYDITFGQGVGNFNGTANLVAAPVPEPATWALMLLGFGALGYAIRRRPKVAARIRFA